MKILLGTHQLEVRAGSELFTAELARAIRSAGHDVAVFTFFKGKFAQTLQADGIPVFHPEETSAIARFAPDLVQTNHLPCAHFLRSAVPDAIRVHAVLGVTPALEAPPLDAETFSLGLAISEEVVDRINRTPFGRAVEIALFRNWFDDKAVVTAAAHQTAGPLRVAVISNHIAPDLSDALTALEAEGAVAVNYFGIERQSVVVDGNLLTQYGLIISIGRTVLLAAACGVPCIVADVHGSDGLLTADSLDSVKRSNFSGRFARQAITKAHLRQEIEKLRTHDRELLRKRVSAEFSLNARADWLLARYQKLLAGRANASPNPAGECSRLTAPGEGLVHAEIAATVRELRGQLDVAQLRIAELEQNQSRRLFRRIYGWMKRRWCSD
jgi:hypothetical protein